MPSLHRRAAPGQASIEYVGLLSLVSVVLGLAGTAVAAPDVAGSVQNAVREGLCRVAGGICTSREAAAADLKPCTIHARRTAEHLRVTIGVIRGRRGDALVVEQRSDGRVGVSFLDKWQGGAETSVGVSYAALGIKGRADAAAGITYQSGRVWTFDDVAGAERFVARWAAREGLAGEAKAAVPFGGDAEDPASPHATFVEGGVFGDVGVDAGARAGGRRLDLGASVEATAVLGRKVERDEITWFVRVESDVAARLGLVLASVGGQADRDVVLEYTATAAGKPVRATLKTVAAVAGELRLAGALTDARRLAGRLRQATGNGAGKGREGMLLDASVSLGLGSIENREAVHALMTRPSIPAIRRLAERLDADGEVALEVHRTATRTRETGGGVGLGAGVGALYEKTEQLRDLVGAWAIAGGGPLREREDCVNAAQGG